MVSASLEQVLARLGELRDPRKGLPITSHRPRIGRVLVAGKSAMRAALTPFINELLRKQADFNEDALLVLRALVLDMKSLQDAALASQQETELRLRRLEKQVERLLARETGTSAPLVPAHRE
jgi:hypothetical protein